MPLIGFDEGFFVFVEHRFSELISLNIIRIGTSGCLQEDVPLDSLLVSQYGIGLDGLLNFYHQKITSEEKKFLNEFINYPNEPHIPQPYIAPGSQSLIEKIGKEERCWSKIGNSRKANVFV